MTSRKERAVLAVLGAVLSVMATYAVLRIVQACVWPEPNPAHTNPSSEVAMFWRARIGAYVGGFVAWLVFTVVPRGRALSLVTAALPVVALLLALQAIFVP